MDQVAEPIEIGATLGYLGGVRVKPGSVERWVGNSRVGWRNTVQLNCCWRALSA
jgi:hypothetical protein